MSFPLPKQKKSLNKNDGDAGEGIGEAACSSKVGKSRRQKRWPWFILVGTGTAVLRMWINRRGHAEHFGLDALVEKLIDIFLTRTHPYILQAHLVGWG